MKSAQRKTRTVPLLYNGDRLTQKEFHRRYEAYPDPRVRFELIGGKVYMSSPARWRHGRYDTLLGTVLCLYDSATPGVQVVGGATAILGPDSEPQPDLALRILPEYGGRCHINEDQYWVGAAELMAEISHSSISFDLHEKKDDYQKAGVLEYLVVCVEEEEIRWFDLRSNALVTADDAGVMRSRVFPGLWIDVTAFFAENLKRLQAVLEQGLASPEHARFVKELAARKASRKRKGRNGK